MKKYLVTELWKSLMSEDKAFEGKNINDIKKQYLEANGLEDDKIYYDSSINMRISSQRILVIQEGYMEGNNMYIRGKRYFYKVAKKDTVEN